MQTSFTAAQLEDSAMRRSNEVLRTCVHCGFCTATCPTYRVLGDECDSPRGRIYLIKNMLETGGTPDSKTVMHIDRCLSCLACMTTCPSGVHYMHLVDHAREYIEENYRRPWTERALRVLLALVLPYPKVFRVGLLLAKVGKPFRSLVPDRRLRAMLDLAPESVPPVSRSDDPQVFPAEGERKMRVALMTGCAQRALDTDINDATIRLLTRSGCDVVVVRGTGCCGALVHHMGKSAASRRDAARNIRAWMAEDRAGGLDAVVINTSGCGTTVKDYGHLMRDTPLAGDAARISELAQDITEVMAQVGLGSVVRDACAGLRVAYHPACSLQHGQQVRAAPKQLLEAAGFSVVEPLDAHICCGSAGTYNILQPEISGELRDRKAAALAALSPQLIAAGNIGCMIQIRSAAEIPVVHTVELLDWATGGPLPPKLAAMKDAWT